MEQNFQTPTPPPIKESKLAKVKNWLRSHKKLVLILTPIILLLIASGIVWFVAGTSTDQVTEKPKKAKKEEPPPPTELPSLTNGVVVPTDIHNRHPVAVMIENSTAARPQVGLTSADVVYEAVTEGGITRFMGIYSQNLTEKAGPVRSARSYFIDWLSEYDAFYAHAGGSPTALQRIGEYGIKDYPHSSDAYWREPRAGVSSEHTLFTNVAKIYQFGVEKKKWPKTIDFKPWNFKDPSPTPGAAATVNINFSSPLFAVKWNFDPATNTYSRIMAGAAHKDRVSGEQITARTVVAMTVTNNPNPPYRGTGKESEWTMDTIGSGNAAVYQDGQEIKATWKKPARQERTRFFDETGKEIDLNRGKIWIEVVPHTGNYSQTAS